MTPWGKQSKKSCGSLVCLHELVIPSHLLCSQALKLQSQTVELSGSFKPSLGLSQRPQALEAVRGIVTAGLCAEGRPQRGRGRGRAAAGRGDAARGSGRGRNH